MQNIEKEIKYILQEYKIKACKEDNYNLWLQESSILGKKIGVLRKSQRRQVIANFLEIIIRWNNLKFDKKGLLLFIETFIGKQYDARLILDILLKKIDIKEQQESINILPLKEEYYPILERRIIEFDKLFSDFIEKENKNY